MIIKPEITEEEFTAILEKVTRFITERGGNITEVNQWGKRRLAYPINHFEEGSYVLTRFKLSSNLIAELEANLLLLPDILRHLLIRLGEGEII
jgi:small subunit ribosomal protein S6